MSLENAKHFEKKPEFLQSLQDEGKKEVSEGIPTVSGMIKRGCLQIHFKPLLLLRGSSSKTNLKTFKSFFSQKKSHYATQTQAHHLHVCTDGNNNYKIALFSLQWALLEE